MLQIIRNLITFQRKAKNSDNTLIDKIAQSHNPYLQGRLEWNHLFNDIMKAKCQWRWTAFLALTLNLLLTVDIIYLHSQSQFIPFAVKVDQLGNALYAGALNQEKTITPIEVNAFLRQFIINARSVMVDAFAQKRALNVVYSLSLPPVRKLLDSHYREQNPFDISRQELVEIQVQSVIQKSTHTWQVDWVEIHRSLDGQVLNQTHFEALMTIAHIPVKNVELLNTNPLSLFIQQLSWAQQG